MSFGLYEYELKEGMEFLANSLVEDNDEYLVSITENNSDVAMVLIEKTGEIYINKQAQEKLKAHWKKYYSNNISLLLPGFVSQLIVKEISYFGVKTSS